MKSEVIKNKDLLVNRLTTNLGRYTPKAEAMPTVKAIIEEIAPIIKAQRDRGATFEELADTISEDGQADNFRISARTLKRYYYEITKGTKAKGEAEPEKVKAKRKPKDMPAAPSVTPAPSRVLTPHTAPAPALSEAPEPVMYNGKPLTLIETPDEVVTVKPEVTSSSRRFGRFDDSSII